MASEAAGAILQLARTLHSQCKRARENERECSEVAVRCLALEVHLSGLQAQFDTDKLYAVKELEALLQKAQAFVEESQKRGKIRAFFGAGNVAEQFASLNQGLDRLCAILQVGLTEQVGARLHDVEGALENLAAKLKTGQIQRSKISLDTHARNELIELVRREIHTTESDTSPKAPQPEPTAGMRPWEIDFNDLSLLQELGRGASATVWAATWAGQNVAVKLFPTVAGTDLRKFWDEVEISYQIRHSNVLAVHGACVKGDTCGIVMERASQSLFHTLHDSTTDLSLSQRFLWLAQVANALRFLHARKPHVIHADIKSLNVLLDYHNSAKVADFGLSSLKADVSTLTGNKDTTEQDGTSPAMGSLLWMAPELLGGADPTPASDVYAYGILMFEVLTRAIPFEETKEQTVLIHMVAEKKKRPSLDRLPPACPRVIRDLMVMCWGHEPARRPTFEGIVEVWKEYADTSGDRGLQAVFRAGKGSSIASASETAYQERILAPRPPLNGAGAGVVGTGASVLQSALSEAATGRVIVKRRKIFKGSSVPLCLYIDNEEVGRIVNGGRCTVPVIPGRHSVKLTGYVSMTKTTHESTTLFVSVRDKEDVHLTARVDRVSPLVVALCIMFGIFISPLLLLCAQSNMLGTIYLEEDV